VRTLTEVVPELIQEKSKIIPKNENERKHCLKLWKSMHPDKKKKPECFWLHGGAVYKCQFESKCKKRWKK